MLCLSHIVPRVPLSTSSSSLGLMDKFVRREDLNKRPSAAEIALKKLPSNTPTLGERIRRDRRHEMMEYDPKSGYFKGETGTWRDLVDPKTTTKEVMTEGYEYLVKNCKRYVLEDIPWNWAARKRIPNIGK